MATIFWDRYTRYNSYRLLSVEANDQWRLSSLGPFQQQFKEKNIPISKKKVHFHQDAWVHTGTDGQIQN